MVFIFLLFWVIDVKLILLFILFLSFSKMNGGQNKLIINISMSATSYINTLFKDTSSPYDLILIPKFGRQAVIDFLITCNILKPLMISCVWPVSIRHSN